MGFAFAVGDHVPLAFEPFGAFNAVKLAQARQVFGGLCVLVLGEVFGISHVLDDLVEISVDELATVDIARAHQKITENAPGLAPRLRARRLVRYTHCERCS